MDKMIWILAPKLETTETNLSYYYDFEQSINEYKKVFEELKLQWRWQLVNNSNFKDVIDDIINEPFFTKPVFFNLCDGDGINDIPGIEVVKYLEKKGLIFTGADEYFYQVTTSKIVMKKIFDACGVPTPAWKAITSSSTDVFSELCSPLIIKPVISAGSMGVGIKSVVHDLEALHTQVASLENGYHGWHLADGGIIAEEYINGPEFTALIIGDFDDPDCCLVYEPVERVFHKALPDEQKFLSFDRLWEIYEDEKPIGDHEDLYNYCAVDASIITKIKELSLAAYIALQGKSYGRVDLRMDKNSKKLYVLEVNAQCGLSDDENYTSIGAILRLSGETFTNLIMRIINIALRKGIKKQDQEFTSI